MAFVTFGLRSGTILHPGLLSLMRDRKANSSGRYARLVSVHALSDGEKLGKRTYLAFR
jgi:hypothetical protein